MTGAAIQLRQTPDGVIIPVRAKPRAGRSRVEGPVDGALVVRVTAPPVEGEANQAVIKTVAEWLGVRRSQVALISGQSSRLKRLQVTGITAAAVAEAVDRLTVKG